MGAALSCQCFESTKEEGKLEVVPSTQLEEEPEETTLVVGGVQYVGQVKGGLKHGFGVLIRPCGSRFEGHFKNGIADGEGKFFHPSGDKYEGQWKDNKANGKGKFTHADGSSYEGDWVSDVQQGEGVERWKDGSSYKGQYMGGMKHGKGAFMWPDGSVYEGEFLENDIHGFGTYTWSDKKKYTGQWVHNHMDGKGQMRLTDGRVYEGGYRYDKKHGKGKVTWPDGRWFEGEWLDGRQHGIGCYFSADGRPVSEVEWSFGRKVSVVEGQLTAAAAAAAAGERGCIGDICLWRMRFFCFFFLSCSKRSSPIASPRRFACSSSREGPVLRASRVKRSGWLRSIDPLHAESVADHSFGVAAHFLALTDEQLVGNGGKPANRSRCMMMALTHDLAESVVGDLTPFDNVSPEEKQKREREALVQICSSLDSARAAEVAALWEEYESGQTAEAQLVKDADKLEMISQAFEYEKLHGVLLEEFFKSTENAFKTNTFRMLSRRLREERAAAAERKNSQCENGA
ncbi:hypothetical protein Efla_001801 [Eimeria flavescens]